MRNSLKTIFAKRQYKSIVVLCFVFSYSLFALVPSLQTIRTLFSFPGFTFLQKIKFLFTSVISFTVSYPAFSVFLSFVLAILLSLSVATSVYIYRRNYGSKRSALSGIIGGLGSAFGAGCFACGNIALGFVFAGIGGGALLARLPLKGLEVDILAVLLLGFSLWYNLRLVEKNGVCEVK